MIIYKNAAVASFTVVKVCFMLSTFTIGISILRLNKHEIKTVAEQLHYFPQSLQIEGDIKELLETYDTFTDKIAVPNPEELPDQWFNAKQVHPDYVPELGSVLSWLSTVRIVKVFAGVNNQGPGAQRTSGTTAKLQFILENGHKALFKIKNFERNDTHFDKSRNELHNAEIAAYHLQRVLGFNRAPLAVGRRIHIKNELMSVASTAVVENTRSEGDDVCISLENLWGQMIEYCGEDGYIEGVMLLWLPKRITSLKLPIFPKSEGLIRKFIKKDNKGLQNSTFPSSYSRYLDHIDSLYFDHMIQNYDRRVVYYRPERNSAVLLLDNGKGFRSLSISDSWLKDLAARECRIRASTYKRMNKLKNGVLSAVLRQILSRDPIAPVLAEQHYEVLDIRLHQILQALNECIDINGRENVLVP